MTSAYPSVAHLSVPHISVPHISVPRILAIAGTDPSGGAGTAADTKSITAAGGYAMSAVTAVVAQNTTGVRAIHYPPVSLLRAQLDAVSDDVVIDAVKTGMLGTTEVIAQVSDWLDANPPRILVVDPVMIASSGDRLLDAAAETAMRVFCQRATVVTPNIDELAVLTGHPRAKTQSEALVQAADWAAATGVSVVVKTGHLTGHDVTNTWVHTDGTCHPIAAHRIDTTSTHGTGCSLSAALATRLGAGDSPATALAWATDWLHESIAHGADLQVGHGHGPVDHSHRARRLAAAASAVPWVAADDVPTELCTPETLVGVVEGAAHPAVAPAGPWTSALWQAGAEVTHQIAGHPFVQQLVAGTLPGHAFAFYLAQDALYLNQYARALAALATGATEFDAQVFWATSSRNILTDEAELHRTWLSPQDAHDDDAAAVPSPVTRAYTDFLLAETLGSPRVVGTAAVLPCFWLYAQTGATLPEVPADHPYANWLATYQGEAFVTDTQQALAQVERDFTDATPAQRAAAVRAYLTACHHELAFFDQALRIPVAIPTAQQLLDA